MSTKEKFSILESMRNKPKPKPPFAIIMHASEIEAFLHQHLSFDEDNNTEDDDASKYSAEEDTFIIVNSAITKNTNPDELCNLLSTTTSHKKKSNPKTKFNKDSTSAKNSSRRSHLLLRD